MTDTSTPLDIEKEIAIAAPVERVWRALTDHEAFGTWFRVALDGPFAVGRSVTGKMTYPGFEGWPFEATVVAMDAPTRFVFTWVPDSGDEAPTAASGPRTTVTFTLRPSAGGTILTVREAGFERLDPARRVGAMRDNEKGWEIQMQNIAEHVAAG
ncbi:SRPBCC family protein [Acuticoccus kandeliae]|uniref:SRPBCC family protein n=1 Tax=Acuticoccus kandeliae TaxID=2073160 RepID=UPI000D3E80FB|nr:SRPBCC family protein [Acuticoccus kandeliae]